MNIFKYVLHVHWLLHGFCMAFAKSQITALLGSAAELEDRVLRHDALLVVLQRLNELRRDALLFLFLLKSL